MPAKKKTFSQKVVRALEKRWVQVSITLLTGALLAGISSRLLAPKLDSKGQTADKSKLKFMHCHVCNMEMAYNAETVNKPCPKCRAPKVGNFIATEASVKAGFGGPSPWRWYNLAITLEAFVTVGIVVYLLYLPVPDPSSTFYVFPCPHCRQRMRYRKLSLGGLGQCPRCKRPVRFPDEDDAVPEELLLAQEQEALQREAQWAEADHGE